MRKEDIWTTIKAVFFILAFIALCGAALYGCYELFLTILGDVVSTIKK